MFAGGVKAEALLGMDFLEVNKCVVDICIGELVIYNYY